MHIGQVVYDPVTGDKGRVVGFTGGNEPIAKTDRGRLFRSGKDVRGQRRIAGRFEHGELKVCNCAGCKKLLLGACHAAEVEQAKRAGHDVLGLPELVGGRVEGRPYCEACLAAGVPMLQPAE